MQYTDCAAEIAMVERSIGVKVHRWQEPREDFEETAALVAALDLVVSVCTTVIHLAGALGKPVWVMTPFSPEWRYGYRGESMPWYPSARLFRQPAYGQWQPVISDVAQSLSEWRDRQMDNT
jgi:ADP-heptose:LPS heptosyltransferase